MANEITLVSESAPTLRTFVCFLLGRGRNVAGIVIEVLVAFEQLLLPKGLIALRTLVWLLVGMDEHVRLEMPRRNRGIWAQLTSETLLTFVGFIMQLVAVAVRE